MKIAIHHKSQGFSSQWIEYCKKNNIEYKIVNCYSNNIISEIEDCDALMWHFHQSHPKDVLFAKQLIYALETIGKKVFPDFHTVWHFDDKVGQKYLLEAVNAPLAPSYIFYERDKALKWINNSSFPKVFKLRKGASSSHVKLAKTRSDARKLVRRAFGRGFSQYDKIENLKDRWYKYKVGKSDLWNVTKGVLRFLKTTEFAKTVGREKGYVYFQDFISGNNYDMRVIVIGNRAYAIRRQNRATDFRASGSTHFNFVKKHFDEETIRLSFKITDDLKSQCLAFDYIYKDGKPVITELSYGFPISFCQTKGYWDRNLNWHEGNFDARDWMVESLIS